MLSASNKLGLKLIERTGLATPATVSFGRTLPIEVIKWSVCAGSAAGVIGMLTLVVLIIFLADPNSAIFLADPNPNPNPTPTPLPF
jgi:hypothetical protein